MLILKSRLKKSVSAISLFLLGVALSYTVNGAEKNICKVLVDYDFNKMKTPSPWIGWSQGSQTIKLVK